MSVFDELVGQEHVVDVLAAVAQPAAEPESASAMTHAWLFTGPPGSGRSIAARAFAAALQCVAPGGEPRGCGRCAGCHTVLAGTHADVVFVRPQGLSLGVKEARELVGRAALAPSGGHWQILLIEDADRLTEGAANVLLKAIEEPAARTVWLLCVPSAQDLVVTIRSRCRLIALRTPSVRAVESVLVSRDGVEPEIARFAARASSGHVGRARRLATDALARARRAEVLRVPGALTDVTACMRIADELVKAATAEAGEQTSALDETETMSLKEAFGEGGTATGLGRGSSGALTRGWVRTAAAALKDLEGRQKSRATRMQRDALDRTLTDLATFYRDVLVVQLAARVDIGNVDVATTIETIAQESTPDTTLRRLEAVMACRTALDANVNALLAVEAMMVALMN